MKKTLKELRTLKGLTQQRVADDLHVLRTTYARWELGIQPIKPSNRKLIAMYFNVKEDEIEW